MQRKALQLEIRNALGLADELGRYEHAFGKESLAAMLGALRSVLADLERKAGRPRLPAATVDERWSAFDGLLRAKAALAGRRGDFPREHHFRLEALLASADRVIYALEHPLSNVPSKPLLARLPVARVVPQDVHTAVDWLAGLACIGSAIVAEAPAARAAGVTLGAASAALSLVTDDRLSPVRRLRIEAHEVLDYVWGGVAIAAPIVLGYGRGKRGRLAAALSVAAGVVSILSAVLTDYRAESGISAPIRSRGGPHPVREPHRAQMTLG